MAQSWVTVPATDARIQYVGRTYRSSTGVVFSHPGVTVRARFWGDALRMRLDDAGTGGEVGTNHFDVSVDGAPPTRLAVRSGEATYPLTPALTVGLHTVELLKRTESIVGPSKLVALEVHGELREPPARPGLRMEFIGDSITCGYGTDVAFIPESRSWRAPTFTSKHQNPRRTYAWLTAMNLGAEPVLVCYSGHGVYRNLDLTTSGLLPALYGLAVPGHPAAWEFTDGSPDVIVINVGTNDTLAGSGTDAFLPDEAGFKAAYRAFLQRLRTLHPRAHIVCTLGSMTDGYKKLEGHGVVKSVHVGDWITGLVEERRRSGDTRVHRHVMAEQDPATDGVAEDWHPSAATHQKMAESLTRFIRDVVLP
ncbi:SGNH/GDSL hydrolase family protein [Corallococcus sp. BB11-1]|uniref:SGNH/GDSL hydrolase family protein n=1 Tax=Corallococcus sp. BB11-1 TaxID=2996783 RepID=UPI002270426D|nr:SGNH/GDSL hydrolase family protein [Corallococcus sp. BB11-1]MCY1033017.1 SGNH/GDSL hydrolase family protein [Corallococcus sp. BB11-1]